MRSHISWRTRLLLALLVLQGMVTTGIVVALLVLLNSSGNLAADRGAKAVTLATLTTQNRNEVTRLGGTPIGPDPGKILRGDPGPAGQDGATGPSGPSGRPGRDGRDATPAQVAAAVAAYMKAHPIRNGAPGTAGPAGQSGANGADGQSPACMAEPDQCRGPAGPAGPQGPAGAAGADGAPPGSWLWTDPVTKVSFECHRDGGPDTAPAYACTVVN